jgi:hypothetical protein
VKKLLLMLVLLGGAGGGAYVLATSPQDNIRPVSYNAEASNRISLKATHLPGGLVSVTVTEQELTQLAREEAQRQGYTSVTELQVACERGELVASGRYALGGVELPVLAHLTLEPADTGIKVNITNSQVGKLPIPFDLSTYVQDGMNKALQSSGLPRMQIRKVTIDQGTLTIEAQPVLA